MANSFFGMGVRGLICTVLLASCSLTPDFERPEVPLGETFTTSSQSGESVANISWWDFYSDPKLRELIEIALRENRDLKQSLARVAEARALLGVTRADQFPFVDLSAGAQRLDPGELGGFSNAPYNDFNVAGQLSFEIDLWGKLSSLTEAQKQELFASEYTFQTVTLSLVAQVADTYFRLVDLDRRVQVAERTVKNRSGATGIIRARFEKGIVAEFDVNQAQIEEADVMINLASFERERQVLEHALQVLLGRSVGPLLRATENSTKSLRVELPAGVPAVLLERRPDIAASEALLKAELSRVGAARALQFPSLSVLGTLGLRNSDSGDLFDQDSKVWSAGGGLLSPLIDWGKNLSRVEAQEARVVQAQAAYQQAVLRAVQEVEDALVSIRTYDQEHAARQVQLKAAANAARLSRARYDDGLSPYIEVLDSERSLFTAEVGVSQSLQSYLSAIVQLYKALGGGWDLAGPQQKPAT